MTRIANMVVTALKMAGKCLNSLKITKKMQFIKVSDGLPPVNENDQWDFKNGISKRVVVLAGDFVPMFGRYYYNEKSPRWRMEGLYGFDQNIITHWMEIILPEK